MLVFVVYLHTGKNGGGCSGLIFIHFFKFQVAVVVAAVPVVAEVDGEVLPDLILVLPVQALEVMPTKKVKGKKPFQL